MIHPTEQRFIELVNGDLVEENSLVDAGSQHTERPAAKVIPLLYRVALDTETPLTVFKKLVGSGPGYLLESLTGGEPVGRYSFIGAQPRRLLLRHRGRTTIHADGQVTDGPDNPFEALRRFAAGFQVVEGSEELPRFIGGAVGYLAYDAVRHVAPLPPTQPDDLNLPEACFLDCRLIAVIDHSRHHLVLVAPVLVKEGIDLRQAYQEGRRLLDAARAALAQPLTMTPMALDNPRRPVSFTSPVDRPSFEAMVEEARRQIEKGTVAQVVVSRRLEAPTTVDPFDLYRAVRVTSPSPYMFFFQPKGPVDFALVGASPEMLVRVEDGQVTVRPLAGTRPRGRDEDEDQRLAAELLADPKEQKEHAMLVDLGREDLQQVCSPDSIHVDTYMAVERHSHVMHLVSRITGGLRPGCDAVDALIGSFPAGTLSGTPRHEALNIIDRLEPVPRGPYGGAFGYLSFSGNLDTCIIIRTMVTTAGRVLLQTGAGVVADSVPANEFIETENKARAALTALALAQSQ